MQTHVSAQCVALNHEEEIALISAWLPGSGKAVYEQVLEMKQGCSVQGVIAGQALCRLLQSLEGV